MAQFVAGGGVDAALQRMITGIAFARFAKQEGMVVSKRAVDGALASIPGLQGIDGSSTTRPINACSPRAS